MQFAAGSLEEVGKTTSIHVFQEDMREDRRLRGGEIGAKATKDEGGVKGLKDVELIMEGKVGRGGGIREGGFGSKEGGIAKVKCKGDLAEGARA